MTDAEDEQVRANIAATRAATEETKHRGEMYVAIRDFFNALIETLHVVHDVVPELKAAREKARRP